MVLKKSALLEGGYFHLKWIPYGFHNIQKNNCMENESEIL